MSDNAARSPQEASASRERILAQDPLRDFFVWWDGIGETEVEAYRAVLTEAADERPLQRHFSEVPRLLVQHLHGGHGRWVIPQKRLGAEFVPDFVIGERYSGGLDWILVELQSPKEKLFLSKGRMTEHLDEGIRQILEWRRWLNANRDYARRSRDDDGLGLTGIDGQSEGLLLIGREVDLSEEDRRRRKQLAYDHRIKIRTYDWVIREARSRIEDLRRSAASRAHPE